MHGDGEVAAIVERYCVVGSDCGVYDTNLNSQKRSQTVILDKVIYVDVEVPARAAILVDMREIGVKKKRCTVKPRY